MSIEWSLGNVYSRCNRILSIQSEVSGRRDDERKRERNREREREREREGEREGER